MRLFDTNITLSGPTMFFVGVTTDKSFVNVVFDDWMRILKKNAELIGVNLPVNCDPNEYTKIVAYIKSESLALGSLVTTHKVRLYSASRDQFDILPRTCVDFEEIGAIFKLGGKLSAEVTDIFSVKSSMNQFLPRDYFLRSQTDLCILGSGGAGLALAYTVLTSSDPQPNRLILTDINPERIDKVVAQLKPHDRLNILRVEKTRSLYDTDKLIEGLADGCVIVNATGLGKDREGSPFSQYVDIPKRSILWDFNYRGKLDFLHIARGQASKKGLQIYDGWVYFVNGWARVIEKVFHVAGMEKIIPELLMIAESKRKRADF